MKDIVLGGFIKSFAESRGLADRPHDETFEAFAASSVLRKYHQSDTTDIEDDILVGGGGDGGIDAVVILVNGRPAMTKEDVDFFIERMRRLEVEFVFVQAKTSPVFNSSDIGSFGFGVEQFFAGVLNSDSCVEFNRSLQQVVDLACYVYEQSIHMQENPSCFLYYVTTGDWTNATDPKGRMDYASNQLRRTNLFTEVQVTPIDAELLKTIYRGLERGVVAEVEFSKVAVFPKIDGVEDAYIGLLPGNEFVQLVSTADGELNRDLFYDNVRDYQGNNPVNREINHTLVDDQLRSNFPLLNNGVTIVARSINRIGDMFRISDYQIVNGCQTAHILFQNRANVGPDTFVPVKLVATIDSQVVAEVVKATNNQTAVLPEALESLTPFHKELEDFYATREARIGVADHVYYERRSKQYAMDKISQANIVTLTKQIKSFVGMFLDEPHSHPRYYGELLKSYEGRIFANDHKPDAYYASGVALLSVERWLNSGLGDRRLRAYRYQLLMLLRILVSGHDMPRMNSRDISDYSLTIVDSIRSSDGGYDKFARVAETLRGSLSRFQSRNRGNLDRNPPHRLKAFTEQLKQDCRVGEPSVVAPILKIGASVGDSERGKILWYDDWKNYGFISRDDGGSMFMHQTEIDSIPWHLRRGGTRVQYTVARDPKLERPDAVVATAVELERSPDGDVSANVDLV